MSAEQRWSTTMHRERRTILHVGMEDAEMTHQIFQTLMGDAVEPPREFIEANIRFVTGLDVQ